MEPGNSSASIITAIRIRPLNSSDGDRQALGSFVFKDYGVKGGLVCCDPTFYHRYPVSERRIAMQSGQHSAYERRFNFDFSFEPSTGEQQDDPDRDQSEVYRQCGRPLLDHVLEGYNCCLIAYGQTGSGKTFTMMGNEFINLNDVESEDSLKLLASSATKANEATTSSSSSASLPTNMSPQVGLIPRLCFDLFKARDDLARNVPNKYKRFDIFVSFYEIYNEKVYDLLSEDIDKNNDKVISEKGIIDKSKAKSKSYSDKNSEIKDSKDSKESKDQIARQALVRRVRENPDTGAYIENLTRRPLSCKEDFDLVLQSGVKARSTASTQMNANSSRSHAIFSIYIEQELNDGSDNNRNNSRSSSNSSRVGDDDTPAVSTVAWVRRSSRVNLIDLAGSERVSYTGASGARLTEANNINRSLASLADVIKALSSGRIHVPYRNSVLTWLLKDSFSGNSKTSMIATITSSESFFKETLTTLRYIERVKYISTKAVVNETIDNSSFEVQLLKLQRELQAASEELEKSKTFADRVAADHMLKIEILKAQILEKDASINSCIEQLQEKDDQNKASVARYKEIVSNHKKDKLQVEAQNSELIQQLKRLSSDLDRERTLSADRATEIRILKVALSSSNAGRGNETDAGGSTSSKTLSANDAELTVSKGDNCGSNNNSSNSNNSDNNRSKNNNSSSAVDVNRAVELVAELEVAKDCMARQADENSRLLASLTSLHASVAKTDRAVAAALVAGRCLNGLLGQVDGDAVGGFVESDIVNLVGYLDDQILRHNAVKSSKLDDAILRSEITLSSSFEASGLLESIMSSEYKHLDEDKMAVILSEFKKMACMIQTQVQMKCQSADDVVKLTNDNENLSKEVDFLRSNGQRAINIVAQRYNEELKHNSDILTMEAEDLLSELLRLRLDRKTARLRPKSTRDNSNNGYSSSSRATSHSKNVSSLAHRSSPRKDATKKLIFDMFPEIYEDALVDENGTNSDSSKTHQHASHSNPSSSYRSTNHNKDHHRGGQIHPLSGSLDHVHHYKLSSARPQYQSDIADPHVSTIAAIVSSEDSDRGLSAANNPESRDSNIDTVGGAAVLPTLALGDNKNSDRSIENCFNNSKNIGDFNDINDGNDYENNEDDDDDDDNDDDNAYERGKNRNRRNDTGANQETLELMSRGNTKIEKDEDSSIDYHEGSEGDDGDKDSDELNTQNDSIVSSASSLYDQKSRDGHSLLTMSQDLVHAKLHYATLSQEHDELQLRYTKSEKQNQQYEVLIGDLKLKIANLTAEIDDKCAFIENLRQKLAGRGV